ncbi:hypothetical protein BDV09DRAFT_161792 [Aspergillus tetrazonus]
MSDPALSGIGFVWSLAHSFILLNHFIYNSVHPINGNPIELDEAPKIQENRLSLKRCL